MKPQTHLTSFKTSKNNHSSIPQIRFNTMNPNEPLLLENKTWMRFLNHHTQQLAFKTREGIRSGRHSSYSQLRTVILLTQICTRTQQRYSTLRYSQLHITLAYIKLALKTLV